MAQAIYCCKKWLNGRLVRFMSMSPCTGGAVSCHGEDPPGGPDKTGGGGGGTDTDGGGPTFFCPGGYDTHKGMLPQGIAVQSGGCNPGYEPKWNPKTGTYWCCPGTEEPDQPDPGPDPGPDPDPDDKPHIEGCIPITKDYVGGKGAGAAFWNDPNGVIPANTVMRSGDWQGHIVWHVADKKFYLVGDLQDFYQGKADMPKGWNKACPKGWHKVGQECCPDEATTDTAAGDAPGWWDWPENLKGLFARIEERINFLFDNPRGLTDAEKQTIANYATQRIKRGERGEIQATQNWLARSGLAGSGPELEEIQKIRRGTREDVAGVQSEIAIDDARRRFSELMQTSQMTSDMTGRLAGFETITESINAARRGEGRMDMQMILQLLSMLLGGQDDSYNQAMMNWMTQQGQQ